MLSAWPARAQIQSHMKIRLISIHTNLQANGMARQHPNQIVSEDPFNKPTNQFPLPQKWKSSRDVHTKIPIGIPQWKEQKLINFYIQNNIKPGVSRH